MNARSVNAAAGVVQAAMEQGRRTATGIALALDAAQLLMSPEMAAELERMRARLVELETQRAELAERLRAGQTWRQGRNPELVSEDYVSQPELRRIFGIPLAAPWDAVDGVARRFAPSQALRAEVEDQHESPLHHDYRVSRDLPAPDGA